MDDESNYDVSINTEASSPSQSCDLTNPSGQISGSDITDIEVDCVINSFSVGGSVTGLLAGNRFIIQNNLADDLTINSDGSFEFVTTIDDLQSYDVTVRNQPNNPIQPCTVSNGNLSVAGADVTTVNVVCEFGDDLIYRNGFEKIFLKCLDSHMVLEPK